MGLGFGWILFVFVLCILYIQTIHIHTINTYIYTIHIYNQYIYIYMQYIYTNNTIICIRIGIYKYSFLIYYLTLTMIIQYNLTNSSSERRRTINPASGHPEATRSQSRAHRRPLAKPNLPLWQLQGQGVHGGGGTAS